MVAEHPREQISPTGEFRLRLSAGFGRECKLRGTPPVHDDLVALLFERLHRLVHVRRGVASEPSNLLRRRSTRATSKRSQLTVRPEQTAPGGRQRHPESDQRDPGTDRSSPVSFHCIINTLTKARAPARRGVACRPAQGRRDRLFRRRAPRRCRQHALRASCPSAAGPRWWSSGCTPSACSAIRSINLGLAKGSDRSTSRRTTRVAGSIPAV